MEKVAKLEEAVKSSDGKIDEVQQSQGERVDRDPVEPAGVDPVPELEPLSEKPDYDPNVW